jgi:hypothetical protein
MRKATLCFVLVLLGSWSGYGQAPAKQQPTFPRIVAKFERLNQTASISPITIYTPSRAGTFRISVVMVGIKPNGDNGGVWDGECVMTDGAGAYNFGVSINTQVRQTTSTEVPIRAKGGKPITFAVNGNLHSAGSKYNVWVVVEQLM